MDARNILLVEDNEINQDLITEILTRASYHVTLANHGEEALELLGKQKFAVALMDLRMPVMDGYQTISLIREKPELQDMIVVAISAVVHQSEVDKALNSGFDYHLGKPINFDELYQLLNKIFQDSETSEKSQSGKQSASNNQPPCESFNATIDFQTAIKNHAHDQALLANLLNEFFKHYQSAGTDLKLLISQNKFEKAERLAHNIKGVAGSFGATPLAVSARALEQSLIKKNGDYQQLVAGFSLELGKFLEEAKVYLKKPT